MEEHLIYEGKATIEEILALYELGYEFVINNGMITHYTKRDKEK